MKAISLVAMLTMATAISATAADKYWSGSGTWDTTTPAWSVTSSGTYNQVWVNGDNAILEGTGGALKTVTLGEDVTVSNLTINTDDYLITGHTLDFVPGRTIINNGLKVTIESGITGSPDLTAQHRNGWGSSYGANGLFLAPASEPMILGTLSRPVDNYMNILGNATGNTIAAIPKGNRNNKMRWDGPGEWSVAGECYCGEFYINGGTLRTGGRTFTDYRYITPVDGATFIMNGTLENLTFNGGTVKGTGIIEVPVTVPASGVLAPGDSTGTLTITNNNCTINGTLDITVDGENHGAIDVDGQLDISSATLDVTLLTSYAKPFIIATYNSRVGEFATANLPKSTWKIEYDCEGENAIALIPPAAGTVLLIR